MPVKSRSDAEIEVIAGDCRRAADSAAPASNIIELVQAAAKRFSVLHGLKFVVLENAELPDREAEASSQVREIRVRQSTYDGALRNVPRDRMTIAHELGHLMLEHGGDPHPRRLLEEKQHKAFKPYEDPEHHAKVFAAAFLIPRSLVEVGMTIKQMQLKFAVSEEAARIRHEQIFGRAARSLPDDLRAIIDKMKAAQHRPRADDQVERVARLNRELDRKWDDLEKIPGKDPGVFRKAHNFQVRRSDQHNTRSHYGWCLYRDEIRAYRDLESQ